MQLAISRGCMFASYPVPCRPRQEPHCSVDSGAAKPDPRRRSAGVWQRSSRQPRRPPTTQAASSISLPTLPDTFSISPGAPPLSYDAALAASLRRQSISAAQLLELVAPTGAAPDPPRLEQRLQEISAESLTGGPLLPSEVSAAVDAPLQHGLCWPPGPPAGRHCRLNVPGVADAAVVTRGGRVHGRWKATNQDAFVACTTARPDGTSPALLLGVFDGHGVGGANASRTAAGGLAGSLPALRNQLLADASSPPGSCQSGEASQLALVRAFEAVAGSMRYDGDFYSCGTAALACLVEEGSITTVWAGDCRAVLGLSIDTASGPRVLVHALTRDHKPDSKLERARIAASGKGRVVQLRPGNSRLCASPGTCNLAMSRALGDTWALPLGLTSEPDAVTVALPPPAPVPASVDAGASWPASALDSLMSGSNSRDDEDGCAFTPARHALVLGCDGLWDALSNTEAVAIAMSCPTAEAAALALMDAAMRRWASAYGGSYTDDTTVAVAFIPA